MDDDFEAKVVEALVTYRELSRKFADEHPGETFSINPGSDPAAKAAVFRLVCERIDEEAAKHGLSETSAAEINDVKEVFRARLNQSP